MTPQRLFYGLLAAIVLLVGVGGAGYYLASQNLASGTAKLSQRLADSESADDTLDSLGDLQHQYDRLKPLLPQIDNALPHQKDETKVALQLRNIASESGMQLDSITFPSSSQPGPVSQTTAAGTALAMQVNFNLEGSYAQLQQFLQRQENMDRYTSMTSLGISSADGKKLSVTMNLSVFLKP